MTVKFTTYYTLTGNKHQFTASIKLLKVIAISVLDDTM